MEGFDLFMEIERKASTLFQKGLAKDEDMNEWVTKEYEKVLSNLSDETTKEALEDIFYGMNNYLKFHFGDELGQERNFLL